MKNPFGKYNALKNVYQFQKPMQIVALIVGGIILSILELVGITSIFPLMLVMLEPESVLKGGLLGGIYDASGMQTLESFTLLLVAIIILAFALKVTFNLVLLRYEFNVLNKWRILMTEVFFNALMKTEYEKINQESSGSYVNTIVTSISYITANYIHQCINLLRTLLLAILIVSYMMYINIALFLFISITGAATMYVFVKLQRRHVRRVGTEADKLSQEMVEILQQSIAGFKETKIHQKESFFLNRFSDISKKLSKMELAILFARSLPTILVEFIAILIILASFGVLLALEDSLQVSTVQISFIVILGLRIVPLINRSIVSLALINSSIQIIDKVLKKQKEMEDQTDANALDLTGNNTANIKPLSFKNEIVLSDVSFTYGGEKTACLNNISLHIPKNAHIGIVGPSGSGKTTLVNIILGFISNYEGKYTIDDKAIKGEAIHQMRKITSFVDQQPFLLDSNYTANIAYGQEGSDIDQARVVKCLQDVGLWPHVEKSKSGLHTKIGENGKLLSGGQRQRLVIARALYKGSKILILDEASSALDMESETLLIELLENLRQEITIISIAHRLSTLRKCDAVIFMEDGCIQSKGTFKELYNSNTTFKAYVDHSIIDVS